MIRTKHPLYETWKYLKKRCENKNNKNYANYGGRGIYVCERWKGYNGFTAFVDDMGERPEGMSLDRIDNNGPYSPKNCRWATKHMQNSNSRKCNTIVGVSFEKSYNKWKAYISINKKHIFLGRYTVYEDAVKARHEAENKYKIFNELLSIC